DQRETCALRDMDGLVRRLEALFWQMQGAAERGETPVPDLRNLAVYYEVGAELAAANIEFESEQAYRQRYLDQLKLMDEHAPDHLFTLGLTGIREAFEFDPELIDVDFISFHPYDYERDQVMNELAWYGKELTVPWMVGETAIPADNDSVLFDEQRAFAERTLAQARACGATGYSWWQYKDVRWHEFHPSHMGVLAREGFSRTRQGHLVEGTPKPVADVFRTFDPQAPKGPCMELPNYYNYSGHSTSRICGKLVDASGDPVRQGVIIGWDEHWSASYHTVTLDDGSFELLGDFRFHHWMATGLRYSVKRGDPGEDLFTAAGDSIPTYDLGTITLYGTDRWGSLLEWADRKMQRFGDGHSRVGP
ncbi:MAG: hypothetical protein KBH07_11580, partial [Flavobacteriales bacterium]|nr:hypothetical protein [Flavobacteriales bacterium]